MADLTQPVDERAYWNKRAETFACDRNTPFVERIRSLFRVRPGQSVLDMGCGTGTFALPYAREGHPVVACDFAPRMLERLGARARDQRLDIDCRLLAWEDDWDAAGLGSNAVDAAIASRSLGFTGQRANLEKLDRVARERAAVVVSAGLLPGRDPKLIAALGRQVPRPHEVADIVCMLVEMGRLPVVEYAHAVRIMRFADWDEAAAELRKLAGREGLSEGELERFDAYAHEHYRPIDVQDEQGAMHREWQLDYDLPINWAFIGWRSDGEVWS